jgi:hypothetical protein
MILHKASDRYALGKPRKTPKPNVHFNRMRQPVQPLHCRLEIRHLARVRQISAMQQYIALGHSEDVRMGVADADEACPLPSIWSRRGLWGELPWCVLQVHYFILGFQNNVSISLPLLRHTRRLKLLDCELRVGGGTSNPGLLCSGSRWFIKQRRQRNQNYYGVCRAHTRFRNCEIRI